MFAQTNLEGQIMFDQMIQVQKIGAEKLHDTIEQFQDCEVFLDGVWRELEHICDHAIVNGVWSSDETINLVCEGNSYTFEKMDKLTIRYPNVHWELNQHLRIEPRCLKRNGFIVLNKRNRAWLEWSFRRAELARAILYHTMESEGIK